MFLENESLEDVVYCSYNGKADFYVSHHVP